jgi:hypothetical protein
MNRHHLLLAHAQGHQKFQSRLEALAERAKPGTLGITVFASAPSVITL